MISSAYTLHSRYERNKLKITTLQFHALVDILQNDATYIHKYSKTKIMYMHYMQYNTTYISLITFLNY